MFFSASLICGTIKQNESEFEQIVFLVIYFMLFSIQTATFCWKPHWNRTCHSKVITCWKVVKTIENKRIYFLCLPLSPNQYLRILTHSAWSYHIWRLGGAFIRCRSRFSNMCACLLIRETLTLSTRHFPHVDQFMGVSETQVVCMRIKTSSASMVLLESPQVTISTVFIRYINIASVALIQPQITQKLIQNGGNWAERQNKQKIIYWMTMEGWVLVTKIKSTKQVGNLNSQYYDRVLL